MSLPLPLPGSRIYRTDPRAIHGCFTGCVQESRAIFSQGDTRHTIFGLVLCFESHYEFYAFRCATSAHTSYYALSSNVSMVNTTDHHGCCDRWHRNLEHMYRWGCFKHFDANLGCREPASTHFMSFSIQSQGQFSVRLCVTLTNTHGKHCPCGGLNCSVRKTFLYFFLCVSLFNHHRLWYQTQYHSRSWQYRLDQLFWLNNLIFHSSCVTSAEHSKK